MSFSLLACALLPAAILGNMYDVIEPDFLPSPACATGCAAWSTLNATVTEWFADPANVERAGSSCAQLGRTPGLSKPSPVLDPSGIGGQGAFCFCAGADARGAVNNDREWGYCSSPLGRPEQINLQVASPDTVVVYFVTFESVEPAGLPVAVLDGAGDDQAEIQGVTHKYVTPSGKRVYYMHFVKLAGLAPRSTHSYKVKSGGGAASVWSKVYTFRSPYAGGDGQPTKVDIFGDMGVYEWNNMQNMLADAKALTADAVVHIGDHCYNMGGEDERRGDGYMQAYEPVISTIPWIPVVGNHEYYVRSCTSTPPTPPPLRTPTLRTHDAPTTLEAPPPHTTALSHTT